MTCFEVERNRSTFFTASLLNGKLNGKTIGVTDNEGKRENVGMCYRLTRKCDEKWDTRTHFSASAAFPDLQRDLGPRRSPLTIRAVSSAASHCDYSNVWRLEDDVRTGFRGAERLNKRSGFRYSICKDFPARKPLQSHHHRLLIDAKEVNPKTELIISTVLHY